jgi:co-chaperonin GroES (HSP10)
MRIKPCGFQVIIEMEEVKNISVGGIVLATKGEHDREVDGHDVGRVVEFGPQCYLGYGCKTPQQWCENLDVGSLVEFRRYDGKRPRHDHENRYRCINDSDIIMVIEDE